MPRSICNCRLASAGRLTSLRNIAGQKCRTNLVRHQNDKSFGFARILIGKLSHFQRISLAVYNNHFSFHFVVRCFMGRRPARCCPRSSRAAPNPGAARDAPRTSREPGPPFSYTAVYEAIQQKRVLPVSVFGKSTRELSGHTKDSLSFVWFHFRKQGRENQPPFEFQLPPIFCVCIREVSSKTPKDFFGDYRYFAGADSEYWHGALKMKKNRSWLAFGVYTFPTTISQTLHPGSQLMVVYLACAGVGVYSRIVLINFAVARA